MQQSGLAHGLRGKRRVFACPVKTLGAAACWAAPEGVPAMSSRQESENSNTRRHRGSILSANGSLLHLLSRRGSPKDGNPPALGLPPESVFPATFTRADLKPKGVDRLVIHPDNRVTRASIRICARACVTWLPHVWCLAHPLEPQWGGRSLGVPLAAGQKRVRDLHHLLRAVYCNR